MSEDMLKLRISELEAEIERLKESHRISEILRGWDLQSISMYQLD